MSLFAQAIWVVFIAVWCVAAGGWIYGVRYWFDRREGSLRKALRGFGVFVGAAALGLAAGVLAELWGGGWS